MSESAINVTKKPELAQKITTLKRKVAVDSEISSLCNQISKLNDTISQLHSANEKIRSELAVVKNVNTKLEERFISLEKNQAKYKQYSRHNNTELSGIPNDIPEDNLEKILIDICHDSSLEIYPKDIEGCHRLPASKYSRDLNKSVIIKFINKKHPEALLRNKKSICSKDSPHLNVDGKGSLFLFVFVLTTSISGISVKTYKEVFCLGGTMAVKVTEGSSARKIFHECNILDLDTDNVQKRLN